MYSLITVANSLRVRRRLVVSETSFACDAALCVRLCILSTTTKNLKLKTQTVFGQVWVFSKQRDLYMSMSSRQISSRLSMDNLQSCLLICALAHDQYSILEICNAFKKQYIDGFTFVHNVKRTIGWRNLRDAITMANSLEHESCS